MIILTLPLLIFLFNKEKAILDIENRMLGEYGKNNDDYYLFQGFFNKFNDSHGLRESFITIDSFTKLYFFQDSPSSNVIKGKNGWFFYNFPNDRIIENMNGEIPFSVNELVTWRNSLESKYLYLEAMDIRYFFFITPNKHSIYPEYIPETYGALQGTTRYEELNRDLLNNNIVTLLNPSTILNDIKFNHRCYNKTDTHWNEYGAFHASRYLCEEINKYFKLKTVNYSNYSVEYTESPSGDLADLIGCSSILNEIKIKTFLDDEELISFSDINLSNSLVILRSLNPSSQYKALVFHDSMFVNMRNYFSRNFAEVIYIHRDFVLNEFQDTINHFKPDLIVEQIGERKLNYLPVDDTSKITYPKSYFKCNYKYSMNAKITSVNHLTLKKHRFCLELLSYGNDPYFEISDLVPLENDGEIRISCMLFSPASTVAKLYYTNKGNSFFEESHVVKSTLQKGFNNFTFEIRSNSMIEKIRFDPGECSGKFKLFSFEVLTH